MRVEYTQPLNVDSNHEARKLFVLVDYEIFLFCKITSDDILNKPQRHTRHKVRTWGLPGKVGY